MKITILKENELSKAPEQNMERDSEINKILDEIDYDFNNLKPKPTLNRKFWDRNRRLNGKTADKLLDIAKDFAIELDIEDKIKNVIFTGSLASYNWHKKSDIDLHLVINYEDFDEKPEIMKQLFDSLRSNWNKKHKIMIRGHEVEIYIQDEDEEHHANGVYSLIEEDWLIKPMPLDTELDIDGAKKKAEGVEKDINEANKLLSMKRHLDARKMAEKIKEKVRNLRLSGLKGEGIYSIENIAFKILRNSNLLDKLDHIYVQSYDKMMSIIDISREIDINLLDEEQLNEKMMLKPGPNGWDLYSKLVAEAYLAAPKFESRAVPHFEAMIPFVEKMFKRIQSKVKIEFVDYHAYSTADELRSDVYNNGVMRVATIDAEHDIFDPETNAKFRAVHDFMAHIQAIGSRGTEFDLKGEIQAYNTHLKTVSPKAWPALFTEVIGQVSTFFYQGGEFAEQKICLLDGFDYENVGMVEGYEIVDKQLVKTEESINIDIENEKMIAESGVNQGAGQHKIEKPQDTGVFQTKTMANYQKDRADYLFLGGNEENGGGKGIKSAPKQAGKSAPPLGECGEMKKTYKLKIKPSNKA